MDSRGAIGHRFRRLGESQHKALVCFVTAGDPALKELPRIVACLESGGADLIEIGIPFSDPIADGPTIQASSQRALDNGVSPQAVLDCIGDIRCEIPMVLMGYYNPILKQGLTKFASQAASAGVSGTIISDLTPEESADWLGASGRAHLDTIFLASPTSNDSRIAEVARRSTGFVYAVSRTGVTGNAAVATDASSLVGRIRKLTSTPICVGFGIRSADQVRAACQYADGAVVGSMLVELIHEHWGDAHGPELVERAVRDLKAATLS